MTLAQDLLTSALTLKTQKKLIFTITAVVFFWGTVYSFTLYESQYRSEARLWIKKANQYTQIDPTVYYNDSQNPMSPVAQAGNPILTQMEILKSSRISQDLTRFIKQKYPKENPTGEPISLKKHLKLKNKIGTDIIEVSFTWRDPKLAQEFLNRIISQYQNIVYDTNNEMKRKRREFIDQKIVQVENDLADISEKIKNYKKQNNVITLQSESDQLTQRKSEVETTLAKVTMQKAGAMNRLSDLKNRLGVSSAKSLTSTAITYDNKAYLQLQDALNNAMQDYLEKRAILSDENPKLIALKEKVDYLEKQIQNLNGHAAGKQPSKNTLSINDPITANVAEDLATSQSNFKDFSAQEGALVTTLGRLNHEYQAMSEKEYTLTQLENMQSVLQTAYRSLKTQQIEAHMNEAENISNIFSVDTPSFNKKPIPITQGQYILLSLLAGLVLGIFAAVAQQKLQQMALYKDKIVSITRKPILGRVPWFSRYADFLVRQESMDHAYNGIVTGLTMQSEKESDRVIVFASPDAATSRKFVMVYDIAKTMARLNKRVALVDCHLQRPAILSHAEQNGHSQNGAQAVMDQLQNGDSKQNGSVAVLTKTSQNGHSTEAAPTFTAQPAMKDSDNLILYDVKSFVKNPYEFFNTPTFGRFIDGLKEEYDWVFIDSPLGHQSPEFPLIAKEADAAVLMLKHQLTEPELREATSLLEEWNIKLLGTIVREYNPKFES